MWERHCEATGTDPETPYEAWPFGAAPDELADLVLRGIKKATTSGFELYAIDDEPMPRPGDLSVILNSADEAVCVIRTKETYVVPFDEVTAAYAAAEGEGDGSLAYWREAHAAFFAEDYAQCGAVFTEKSPVLCEIFEVVWPV